MVFLAENWRIAQLNQRLTDHMRGYGYKPVELPIIEASDLFLIKAGDQIVNKLFTFEHHGKQMALRPEFTASAAYHYMEAYGTQAKQPIARWQFSGYVFADDPNKPLPDHQHFSIGAELIGMEGPNADAEIIGMATQGLLKQSISDLRLTIGHIGLMRQVLRRFQLDNRTERFLFNQLPALKNPDLGKSHVIDQLDQLLRSNRTPQALQDEADDYTSQQMIGSVLDITRHKTMIGTRTNEDIARRLLQKRRQMTDQEQIIAAIEFLDEWSKIAETPETAYSVISRFIPTDDARAQSIVEDLKTTLQTLEVLGISNNCIVIQPDLARFWDYYSGIVFELRTTNGTHLGGGGRYDELSQLLGGPRKIPAVGFAYYIEEILPLLSSHSLDAAPPKYYTIVIKGHSDLIGMRWANKLRQRGLNIQLLPESNVDNLDIGHILFADSNTTALRFNGRQYDFSDIDALIETLERVEP